MRSGASLHDTDDFVLYLNEPSAYVKVCMSPIAFWRHYEQVMAHAAHLRALVQPLPAEAATEVEG